jgi:hypothetical protein
MRAGLALGECHVKGYSGNDRMPGFIFREASPFNRAPQIDYFRLCHGLEEVLVMVTVEG